jgi:biopolymer transport protein ExbD
MRKRHFRSVAEINVTSLVDIMMVLLVIFMLAAPLLQTGVEVRLPTAKSTAIKETEAVTVSVTKDGAIFVNGDPVAAENVGATLTSLRATGEERVLVRGDTDVPYGVVLSVIGEIKAAGITNVGMITGPTNKRVPPSSN